MNIPHLLTPAEHAAALAEGSLSPKLQAMAQSRLAALPAHLLCAVLGAALLVLGKAIGGEDLLATGEGRIDLALAERVIAHVADEKRAAAPGASFSIPGETLRTSFSEALTAALGEEGLTAGQLLRLSPGRGGYDLGGPGDPFRELNRRLLAGDEPTMLLSIETARRARDTDEVRQYLEVHGSRCRWPHAHLVRIASGRWGRHAHAAAKDAAFAEGSVGPCTAFAEYICERPPQPQPSPEMDYLRTIACAKHIINEAPWVLSIHPQEPLVQIVARADGRRPSPFPNGVQTSAQAPYGDLCPSCHGSGKQLFGGRGDGDVYHPVREGACLRCHGSGKAPGDAP